MLVAVLLVATVAVELAEDRVPVPAPFLVLGIFKDEGHIIEEWLNHYAGQGATRVVLIDNGSTDGYAAKVAPYVDTGFVVVVKDDTKHAQVDLYNKYAAPFLGQVDWVVVVDLDEFAFGTKAPLGVALAREPPATGLITMEWVMFGSSHLVSQPPSVLDSFTLRVRYPCSIKPFQNTKYIVRTRALAASGLGIHTATLDKRAGWKEVSYGADRTEESLPQEPFRVNHYPIQSLSWFKRVKMTRGSANSPKHDNVRTMDYFRFYDRNEVPDTTILTLPEC